MLHNSHYCTQEVLILHSLVLIDVAGFQCVWSPRSVLIVKTSSRKEVPALSLLHTLRVKWPERAAWGWSVFSVRDDSSAITVPPSTPLSPGQEGQNRPSGECLHVSSVWFCRTTDKLDVSSCMYVLVGFRWKNHLVRVWKTSWFGLKMDFLSWSNHLGMPHTHSGSCGHHPPRHKVKVHE